MDKMKYIIIELLGMFLCMPAVAQRTNSVNANRAAKPESSSQWVQPDNRRTILQRSRVQYHRNLMKQVGDSLIVDMIIDMSGMKLKANHAQILTPVVGSEKEEIELPQVMIQGTTRNKAFVRELELNDRAYEEFESNLPYAIVKPLGKLHYRLSIPFEPWMSEAFLDVEEDLCGCGDQSKIVRSRIFEDPTKEVVTTTNYNMRPRLSYIRPEVEAVKKRQEIGNAYLDFPRGKNEILPDFGNN
ncbi:MAG: DUF3868 domain-containing protein, partial [Tannerella sp.]|nr:DUF3868 domain-containing protein [Tannerella sp.]